MSITHFPCVKDMTTSYANVAEEYGNSPGIRLSFTKLHFLFYFGGTFTT